MSFKPNRDLLNPKFNGYKLADHSLPLLWETFTGGVHKISNTHSDSFFSYQHVRQATMNNSLTFDPWNDSHVYWTTANTHNIMCGYSSVSGNDLLISPVHHSNQSSSDPPTTNSSLIFLSKCHAFFYEPSYDDGNCLLFYTGDRTDINPWSIISRIKLIISNVTIQSASLIDGGSAIDFMTFQLEDTSTKYCTCVWWRVCLSDRLGSGNIEVVSQTQLCRFKAATVPLYSEYINERLLLVSESVPGIDREEKEMNEDEDSENAHQDTTEYYTGTANTSWNQSSSDIAIDIMIPEDINKSDIICIIESTSISVGLTDGTTYIRGDLLYNIDECTSTWTYSKGKLDITLEKMANGVEWSSLFKDGSLLPSDDEYKLKEMKRKRSTLVGGEYGSPSKCSKQSLITNNLEECDTDDDDQDINVYLINKNGFIVQKMSLNGKQLLYTLQSTPTGPSVLSLRHDIDAIHYSPSLMTSPSSSPSLSYTHVTTFNALGYVQASKREKKYLTATHDGSYAVLTDSIDHIFIYCRPHEGVKGQTAAQYIHTLPDSNLSTSPGGILGVQVTGSALLYVLTNNILYVIKLPHY